MTDWPGWMIFHIPHDSTHIPQDVRDQFVLSDQDLERELLCMTDHRTLDLFGRTAPAKQIVRASVSRLVVDVERFDDDRFEPMSLRGMGAVYLKTHDGNPLRYSVPDEQRRKLLDDWYHSHHDALTLAATLALQEFGIALILDCHSFPSRALPYEVDQTLDRPQICIGTDAVHTPPALASALVDALENAGYNVGLDSPFSGSLVPNAYYRKDRRVMSVMVEVRRDLYLYEEAGIPNPDFELHSTRLRRCILGALGRWSTAEILENPGIIQP
jgi:N-formylglutamate amidohydrolase